MSTSSTNLDTADDSVLTFFRDCADSLDGDEDLFFKILSLIVFENHKCKIKDKDVCNFSAS